MERPLGQASNISDTTGKERNPNTPGGPFDLLGLPRELRDKIYAYVLVDEGKLQIETDFRYKDGSIMPDDFYCTQSKPLSSQLLRTSHLVHAEASKILYSRNRFEVLHGVGDFFEQIRSTNVTHLRHLSISFPGFMIGPSGASLLNYSKHIFSSLQTCSHLQTLTMSGPLADKRLVELSIRYQDDAASFLRAISLYLDMLPSKEDLSISIDLSTHASVFDLLQLQHLINFIEEHGWTLWLQSEFDPDMRVAWKKMVAQRR